MKITKDQLKCWKACKDGYGWFLRRFPDGEAEYQDVLNAEGSSTRTTLVECLNWPSISSDLQCGQKTCLA